MCKLFRRFRALKHVTDEFDPRQLEKFKEKIGAKHEKTEESVRSEVQKSDSNV